MNSCSLCRYVCGCLAERVCTVFSVVRRNLTVFSQTAVPWVGVGVFGQVNSTSYWICFCNTYFANEMGRLDTVLEFFRSELLLNSAEK